MITDYDSSDEYSNDDCEFIDSPVEQSSVDWELINDQTAYHLRVTCDREPGKKLMDEYIKKFKPETYIIGYEEVDKNHHIHCHLVYSTVPSKQSISQWMKVREYSGKYYHQQVKTTNKQNIMYVVKDLDLISHNLPPEHIKKIIELTEEVNENKKMSQRHKLLIEYDKYIDTFTDDEFVKAKFTIASIARWIMRYYISVYDKEPPLAHIKGYSLYIANKCKIKQQYDIELSHLFDHLF